MKTNKKVINFKTETKVLNFFSSLADPTRLKILLSMADEPRSVNEIYRIVGREKMTLSAISHQLRQLKDMGIVSYEKKGREKLFKLSNDFCWCILKDAFKQFNTNIEIRCEKCSNGGKKK